MNGSPELDKSGAWVGPKSNWISAPGADDPGTGPAGPSAIPVAASRPESPATGAIILNTSSNKLEVFDGAVWQSVNMASDIEPEPSAICSTGWVAVAHDPSLPAGPSYRCDGEVSEPPVQGTKCSTGWVAVPNCTSPPVCPRYTCAGTVSGSGPLDFN
jgi:hypothetical protein